MKKKLIKTVLTLLPFPIILGGLWVLSSERRLILFEVIGVGTVVYLLIRYIYRLAVRWYPEDVKAEREHREFIERVSRRTTL